MVDKKTIQNVIQSSVKDTRIDDLKDLISFIEFLYTLNINSLMAGEVISSIDDYIYDNNQDVILDFISIIKMNSVLYDLDLNVISGTHISLINDGSYVDELKAILLREDLVPNDLHNIIMLLRYNINVTISYLAQVTDGEKGTNNE